MSEKGKEKEMYEEEEEREMIDHWSHEHPLTLVETRGRREACYGCEQEFSSGEQAYGCIIEGCQYSKLLHEECAVTARKIRHPLHPQHILIQQHPPDSLSLLYFFLYCGVCKQTLRCICFGCTSSECYFKLHLRCAQDGGMMYAAAGGDDDEQRRAIIRHPSHPKHELKLLRRRCSFYCDACGTTRKGSSYTCTDEACQYWIHERCASLPLTIEREDHHHALSLSFNMPSEYIRFDYKCDVCSKFLQPRNWMYHCQICRFIVHVKCVFNKPPPTIENDADAKDIIHLPTDEVAKELVTPFVMRQGGTLIPPIFISHDDDELVNVKYKFLHHHHELSLVSSSSHDDQSQEEEDEENYGRRWELICDGCITPISFSSSSSKYYYYMSCSECKYNLHMACFHLPPHISLPHLHRDCYHHLLLQSSDKLKPWEFQNCSVCGYSMNGMFYACGECDFKADIKCACLPDTIYHAAHPQHLLNHVAVYSLRSDMYSRRLCASGCGIQAGGDCYKCSNSSCDFIVHLQCALLPASVTSARWDEHHPLPLTYNATQNHPGDFYCYQCETQMNPKRWMYQCRHCDLSFHPYCFQTISGWCRNIKLGQEYVNDRAHPHTLTFQLLTTKRRCDLCGEDRHEQEGFHCALCNFFVCLNDCGKEIIRNDDMKLKANEEEATGEKEQDERSITEAIGPDHHHEFK